MYEVLVVCIDEGVTFVEPYFGVGFSTFGIFPVEADFPSINKIIFLIKRKCMKFWPFSYLVFKKAHLFLVRFGSLVCSIMSLFSLLCTNHFYHFGSCLLLKMFSFAYFIC